MSKLWTFGCSFTAEYDPIEGIHHPFENQFDKFKKFRGGNLPDVWPTILSKHIGFDLMNCAIGGSSNYNILTQFFNVCDLIREGDMVMFGWTSLSRFTAVNLNENIFSQILPCDANFDDTGYSKRTIEEILVNRQHPLWIQEVQNWIKFINLFLKNLGAEVYHWTSDERTFNRYSKWINEEQFIVVRDEDYPKEHLMGYLNLPKFYGGMLRARIVEETNGEIEDDHNGEFGHKNQAKFFYEHISKYTKLPIKKD
jgi:hypothetical protein